MFKKRQFPTRSNPNFAEKTRFFVIFLQKLGSEWVGTSRNEFSRVGTSFRESGQVRKKLKKLVPTPIFEKRQFPKLAKTKILEETV